MELPGGPLVRLTEIPAITKKGLVTAEVVMEPEAAMVWEPEDEDGTAKVVLQPPWELTEMPEATDVPS